MTEQESAGMLDGVTKSVRDILLAFTALEADTTTALQTLISKAR